MMKHRGLYPVGRIWYVRFELDKKSYRYSTGVEISGPPSPEIQALVPRGREQKERAVKAIQDRKTKAASGTTELHAFTQEYLSLKPTPRGIKVKRSTLRHLTAFFPKGVELDAIGRAAANRYHQHIAGLCADGEIAGGTANLRLSYVRAMFNHAIDIDRITGPNPFNRFKIFPARNREFVIDKADEPIFLGCCPPWLRAMIEDNLYLGLRPSELRGLLRIHFRPNKGLYGQVELILAHSKGERIKAAQGRPVAPGTAHISLTAEVRERMSRRMGSLVHEFFYSGPGGRPVNGSTMEKAFRRAWIEAEPLIAKRRGMPLREFQTEVVAKGGCSFYATRHTAATRDGESGFSDSDLVAKYRWKNREMVDTYTHPSDEAAERAAQKRAEAGR